MQDYNSAVNQQIKRKYVNANICSCVTMEIEAMLKCGAIDYEDIQNAYDEETGEYQEIMEWYLVSDSLGRTLLEKGEPIIEYGLNMYWGRTCSGQAVYLDRVISEICDDLEILDGQTYSWARGDKED